MKPVIIFGAGPIAQVAHFYLMHDSQYQIKAFTVDKEFISEKEFCKLPLVPFEEIERRYPPKNYDMFVAVSYAKLNSVRADKYKEAKAKGYKLISYVSSKASVWPGLVVGDNCFILEDNTIQPFVQIGNNVVLWSGNHIGHHCEIADHCFISSHVVLAGGVKIGKNCFLGVNATIRDHITIADYCVIGAGVVILHDTVEYGVYKTKTAEVSNVRSDQLKDL